jgi:ribonuclease HI
MGNRIEVFADGSATTKDNPGGWASVVLFDGILHKELSGHLESATNNDAELHAAINGLDYVMDYVRVFNGTFPHLDIESVTLISDSQIILNWANGSYRFKQEDKLHLYNKLRDLVQTLNAKTKWVKGHSGHVWNERCDHLANLARKKIPEAPSDKVININQSLIGTKKTGTCSIWYGGVLKVIDFSQGLVETYNRDVHGKRGSVIEIREGKER